MKVTAHLFSVFLGLFVLFPNSAVFAQTPIPEKLAENNWAYKTSDNTVLIDGLEKAISFKNGVGIAKKNGKWGALSSSMKQILPFQYEQLSLFNDTLIKGTRKDLYALFTLEGKSIGSGNYTDVQSLRKGSDSLIVANKEGDYGMINSQGNVLIPLRYSGVPHLISHNHLRVYKKKGKSYLAGVIDFNNKEIVPFKFLFIRNHYPHYQAETFQSNKLHYYNRKGERVYTHEKGSAIPTLINDEVVITQTDEIQELQFIGESKIYKAERWYTYGDFYRGDWKEKTTFLRSNGFRLEKDELCSMHQDTLTHYIIQNRRGNGFLVYDKQFNLIYSNEIAAPVEWSERWLVERHPIRAGNLVLIDLNTGKQAIQDTFQIIELMNCDYVKVSNKEETFFYSDQLDRISLSAENSTSPYLLLPKDELIKVAAEYKHLTGKNIPETLLENSDCNKATFPLYGKVVVHLITDPYRQNPLDNRLYIQHNHTENAGICITDMQGKIIVPFGSHMVQPHYQGLLYSFQQDTLDHGSRRLYGLVNLDGEIVIPHRYTEILEIKDSVLFASRRGLTEVVDIKTKKRIIGGYNSISTDNAGYFHIKHQGMSGIADPQGNVLIAPKYHEITRNQEDGGLYKVKHFNKQFYVDLNGNEFPIE